MLPQEVRDRVRSYIQHQGGKSRDAIVELVAAGHEKLLAAVAGIDDQHATVRPAEDEWSLRDLMLHVVAAQNGVAALVERLSVGTDVVTSERVLGMQREDDGATFAGLIDELHASNARMLDAVRGVPDAPDLALKPEHPFFGPLNVWEWAAFQRVHDEDHVQHAQKIIAATA